MDAYSIGVCCSLKERLVKEYPRGVNLDEAENFAAKHLKGEAKKDFIQWLSTAGE